MVHASMNKIIVLLRAAPATSAEVFAACWAQRSAVLAGQDCLQRYLCNDVQHWINRDATCLPGGSVHGIEELWFADDVHSLARKRLMASLELVPQHISVVDALSVRESLIFERTGQPVALTKRMSLLQRKSGWSADAFCQYWHDVHAPLADCHRFVQRYVQNHRCDPAARPQRLAVDGIAEFMITDLQRMQEDYLSEAGQRMRADVSQFVGALSTCVVQPREIALPL